MKKITSILKVFAVSVLLLISTTLFSQQQVIQNLTVVDSLVISSLQNSSLVATNATNPPYRYLVIDPHGNVKAKSIRVIGDTLIQGDPGGTINFTECDTTPGWVVQPSLIHNCPLWGSVAIGAEVALTKFDVIGGPAYFQENVGIGTSNAIQKLQVIGNGVFSGNLGIGTTNPQVKLDIQNNAATEARVFVLGAYTSRIWTANGIYAYGLGIGADGKGHIYENMNIPTPLVTFTGSNVGINCTSPQYKLQVNGTVKATEVLVTATGCDFVFEDKYKLPSIAERKAFIKQHKHLPNIKSAKEMQESGMDISRTTESLLQNIEEHELYIQDMNERMEKLEKENEWLKEQIKLINKK